MVNPAEPAHLVHPSELVFAQGRSLELRREFVVHADHLAIHDEDAGPAREEMPLDIDARRQHRRDPVDDLHDRVFGFPIASAEDPHRGTLETLACDILTQRIGLTRPRQNSKRSREPTRKTEHPRDPRVHGFHESPTVPLRLERPAFWTAETPFFGSYGKS